MTFNKLLDLRDTLVNQDRHKMLTPFIKIIHCEVVGWGNTLNYMAGPIERPTRMAFTKLAKYQHAHSPSTCLPGIVEGFVVVVLLPANRSESLPSAEVVDGIH